VTSHDLDMLRMCNETLRNGIGPTLLPIVLERHMPLFIDFGNRLYDRLHRLFYSCRIDVCYATDHRV